jgi:hypothetical protein
LEGILLHSTVIAGDARGERGVTKSSDGDEWWVELRTKTKIHACVVWEPSSGDHFDEVMDIHHNRSCRQNELSVFDESPEEGSHTTHA